MARITLGRNLIGSPLVCGPAAREMLSALFAEKRYTINPWTPPPAPRKTSEAGKKRALAAEASDDEEGDAIVKRPKPPPRPAPLIHVARNHAAASQLARSTVIADPALVATAVNDSVSLPGDVQDLARILREQTGLELGIDAITPRLLPGVDGKECSASAMAVLTPHVPTYVNYGVKPNTPMQRARGRILPIGWD